MERTIKDKIISLARKIYYSIYERSMLYYVRRQKSYNEYKGLVTIIIPTYNRGEILMKRALKSVLNQTYKFWECIIIGDGCTDNTEELIKSIKDERAEKIHFYNIKRVEPDHNYDTEKGWFISGLNARNYALENEVRGQYIAVLDDDDIWHPEFLAINLRAIKQFDVEFISSGSKQTRHGKTEIITGNYAQSYFYTQKAKTPKGPNPIIGVNSTYFYKAYLKFFKYNKNCWRKKWNKVNDVDFSYRMFKAGVKMGFIKRPLVIISPRPNEQNIGLEAVKDKMKDPRVEKLEKIQKEIRIMEKVYNDKGITEIGKDFNRFSKEFHKFKKFVDNEKEVKE